MNIIAKNGGNIYFSGAYDFYYNAGMTVTTTTNYNIYCSGYFGCAKNNLQNANNIYLLSRQSCYYCNIRNINYNVYGYGFRSLSGANIQNVNGTVYCGSDHGCRRTEINNVTTVYGSGYLAMRYVTITNVKNV